MITKKCQRCGMIDLMKFIFSLVIVIYHARNMGLGNGLFLGGGYLPVEFFFLVSGFLMAKSVKRIEDKQSFTPEETWKFLWRKIRVFLPYYIFAFALSFIIRSYMGDYSLYQILKNGLSSIWSFAFLTISGIKSYSVIGGIWYISAMLISMLIIYPFLRRYRKAYIFIATPIIAILILGYLSQTFGTLEQTTKTFNLVHPGLLRAMAEVSLGCLCFELCQILEKYEFKLFGKIFLTVVEIFAYALVLRSMLSRSDLGKYGFSLLIVIGICIILSFSGKTLSTHISGSVYTWLGKYSMIIYLNHFRIKDLIAFFTQDWTYWQALSVYIPAVLIVSLFCMIFMDAVMKVWPKTTGALRSILIKD